MTTRTLAIGAVVCLAVGAVGGALAYRALTTPKTVTVQLPGNTTTVTVDRPILQTRDVIKVVHDDAESARLMAEVTALKQRITAMIINTAKNTPTGEGKVVYVDRPVPGATLKEAHFRDFRLAFDAVGDKATYALSQSFESVTAFGKDKLGQPTATTRLFEIGPGEVRTQLSDAKTVVVAATPDAPRWHLRASVTAGFGYAGGLNGLNPGGVVGLRWLAHGTTAAAEDTRWAVATPVLWLDSKVQQVGILPVSVNLKFSGNPFRDLWLSPFIGLQPQPLGVGKVGFVIHATF